MTGWDAFGVGVAIGVGLGFVAMVALAVALAWRDGHPFGEFVPDDLHDIEGEGRSDERQHAAD